MQSTDKGEIMKELV